MKKRKVENGGSRGGRTKQKPKGKRHDTKESKFHLHPSLFPWVSRPVSKQAALSHAIYLQLQHSYSDGKGSKAPSYFCGGTPAPKYSLEHHIQQGLPSGPKTWAGICNGSITQVIVQQKQRGQEEEVPGRVQNYCATPPSHPHPWPCLGTWGKRGGRTDLIFF